MQELTHLKTLWGPKQKRSLKTIPQIYYNFDRQEAFYNDHWIFVVPINFKAALDIKYEERRKNKKIYMAWTQGPVIAFQAADTIHSRDATIILQIEHAIPMSWDHNKEEMHQGGVTYSTYTKTAKGIKRCARDACSQMDFLRLLITGNK